MIRLENGPTAKSSLPAEKKQEGPPSQSERNSVEFARRLWETGLIVKGDDTSEDWQELHAIYQKNNRLLPESFPDRLRLLVLIRARKLMNQHNQSLLIKYNDLGVMIDRQWFEKSLLPEEEFIARATEDGKAGRKEDGIGFFRPDNEGNLWRMLIEGEDGKVAPDSSKLAEERAWRREMVAQGRNSTAYPGVTKRNPRIRG